METISSFRREVMRTVFFWAIILKMGPIRFPETSVSSYFALRNSSEQRSS